MRGEVRILSEVVTVKLMGVFSFVSCFLLVFCFSSATGSNNPKQNQLKHHADVLGRKKGGSLAN